MKELNASPYKLISIGYEGEDKVTKTAIRTMLGLEEMYQWHKNNSGN